MANLSNAILSQSNLQAANLSGANLTGVHWRLTMCPAETLTLAEGNGCAGHGGG